MPISIGSGDVEGIDYQNMLSLKKQFSGFVRSISICAVVGALALASSSVCKAAVPRAALPMRLDTSGSGHVVYIPSGYMGTTDAIVMNTDCKIVRAPGTNASIQVKYTSPSKWGGVVWQSPANDWGTQPGGLNLSGAKTLTFYARGAQGGEVVSFKYGLIGPDKKYHDTSTGGLVNVKLTKNWTKYSISLAGKDLSDIKTGFCWVVAGAGKPITFYLGDIVYS